MAELVELANRIEELFAKQYTRIAFHLNQTGNDYRENESRLSTPMLDATLTNEQHLEYAQQVIALADDYKQRFLVPLHAIEPELRNSLAEFERTFGTLRNQLDPSKQNEIATWLALSRKLSEIRSVVVGAVGANIGFDTFTPHKIVESGGRIDVTFSVEESRNFQESMRAYSQTIKTSAAREEEIEKQRDPLTQRLFPNQIPAPEIEPSKAVKTPAIHPLEGKVWFRLLKVIYFGAWVVGLGAVALVSYATNSFPTFIIGVVVVAAALLAVQKLFYYVALGRTSSLEKPGQGFIDLEELRAELAQVRVDTPDVYERVVAPGFASWKERYGRRVPVHELKVVLAKVDVELAEIRAKRQKAGENIARTGATLDIPSLRARLERSKAEYKGPNPIAYTQALDKFLVSLEVKYGKAIPVAEAEKLLSQLEDEIRASDKQ
jgi:hypothetical protein